MANIGSGNGLSPVWRQAITWTSADSLSIGLSLPWNLKLNTIIFNKKNSFENVLQNDGHLVQASMFYTIV